MSQTKSDRNRRIVEMYEDHTKKLGFKAIGKMCLVPANPKYHTIYPKDNLTIEGVVISSMRKYR